MLWKRAGRPLHSPWRPLRGAQSGSGSGPSGESGESAMGRRNEEELRNWGS
jgi:hypothetical protein